jgi:hypothetical protein
MNWNRAPGFVLLSAALLMAADPWQNKPLAAWTAEDAKQVLAKSAWSKPANVAVLPQKGEDQLREGGKMGRVRRPKNDDSLGIVPPKTLLVRWESSLAIRTAELKAADLGAPDWDGDYYVIAIYDIPGFTGNGKAQAGDLKRSAFLQLEGKKEIKPVRVDLVSQANGLSRAVYLFPRSEAITVADKKVSFTAQLGWLSLTQDFYPPEMQLEGKLEL